MSSGTINDSHCCICNIATMEGCLSHRTGDCDCNCEGCIIARSGIKNKASFDAVCYAIDALPEGKNALSSGELRLAYWAARDKTLYLMGWGLYEFIEALSRAILEKEKQ